MSLIIKQIKKEDSDFIEKLNWITSLYPKAVTEEFEKSWMKNHRRIDAKQNEKIFQMLEEIAQHNQTCILLATFNFKNVGYFLGMIKQNIAEIPDKTGYINGLYLMPEFRNKGIGQKLLDEANLWFQKKECFITELYISQNNKEAFKFWEKNGFKTSELIMSRVLKK